jgi:small subunit ribosomal protein S16
MLTIRLQRIGKIKKPVYRLIISEKARDTQDNFLELLGTFDPHVKENGFQPKADRIKYWMDKGADASPTVHNLLVKAGIVKAKLKKAVFISKKRAVKIAEKKKTAEAPAA